uniref:Uncharacterized protein n=1 Tax=Oryza barthii TaxID=65489 RepID=A0A0D3FVB8_9ORYZ
MPEIDSGFPLANSIGGDKVEGGKLMTMGRRSDYLIVLFDLYFSMRLACWQSIVDAIELFELLGTKSRWYLFAFGYPYVLVWVLETGSVAERLMMNVVFFMGDVGKIALTLSNMLCEDMKAGPDRVLVLYDQTS